MDRSTHSRVASSHVGMIKSKYYDFDIKSK